MTLLLICAALGANAIDLKHMIPSHQQDLVTVHSLGSPEMGTEHLMFIKKSIPLMVNYQKTERIYVLSGHGTVTLDGTSLSVKQGDYITVPSSDLGVSLGFDQDVKVLSVLG